MAKKKIEKDDHEPIAICDHHVNRDNILSPLIIQPCQPGHFGFQSDVVEYGELKSVEKNNSFLLQ